MVKRSIICMLRSEGSHRMPDTPGEGFFFFGIMQAAAWRSM
jgi:hypothetical protein